MDTTQIKLTKLAEVENPAYANNIPVGKEVTGQFSSEPQLGRSFHVGYNYATSIVLEILSEDTFKTRNSVYKWEYLKEEQPVVEVDAFVVMVFEMRNLQKAYFRTRDKDILQQSKEAERKVDAYIKQKTDPSLF